MGGAHSGLAYHDSDGSELAFYEQPCEAGIRPKGEHTHSLEKPLEKKRLSIGHRPKVALTAPTPPHPPFLTSVR